MLEVVIYRRIKCAPFSYSTKQVTGDNVTSMSLIDFNGDGLNEVCFDECEIDS